MAAATRCPPCAPPPADVAVTLTTEAGAAILTQTPPVNRYAEMSDRKTRRNDRKPNYDGKTFLKTQPEVPGVTTAILTHPTGSDSLDAAILPRAERKRPT